MCSEQQEPRLSRVMLGWILSGRRHGLSGVAASLPAVPLRVL